jgi:hypothetical protein
MDSLREEAPMAAGTLERAAAADVLGRSDPNGTGIRRRRCGRGFTYLGTDAATIKDQRTLARIKALVIPPAWQEVWICVDPQGHIQAVGIDVAGRRQYRYHDSWRLQRDQDKQFQVTREPLSVAPVTGGMTCSRVSRWSGLTWARSSCESGMAALARRYCCFTGTRART